MMVNIYIYIKNIKDHPTFYDIRLHKEYILQILTLNKY